MSAEPGILTSGYVHRLKMRNGYGLHCKDLGRLFSIGLSRICKSLVGVVPSRIDVITEIDGVNFENAWKEHQTVDINGLRIPVINKSHLLLNKKSTGRQKDLNDVLWMESE